jgi:uncharacterized protein HemX
VNFETVRSAIDLAVAVGIPSAIGWYVRDKKKNKAVRLASQEQQNENTLIFVRDAFSAERESLMRQVQNCGEEIKSLREQIAEKNKRIDELESRMEQLERRQR